MSHPHFLDKVKDALIETDDAPAKPAKPFTPMVQHNIPANRVSATPVVTSVPISVPAGGSIYEKLKAKTNFDQTDVGRLIQSYLAPLANVSMDETTRFKVALQMASHKDNLEAGTILRVFDNLHDMLNHEQELFSQSASSFDAQISDDNAKLQKLADEIAQKQSEMAALANQINSEKSHREQTASEFSSAMQTRAAELDRQKEHYANILKG